MVFRIDPGRILHVAAICLAFSAGALSGLIHAFVVQATLHPPIIVHGSGATVAAVTLDGFRDGALRGHAQNVRLFARDQAVEIAPDGAFAIVHPAFRVEEVSVEVPKGMMFVASKKGKKYYPVTSAGGERIVPENRVYFPNETAARAAGFVP